LTFLAIWPGVHGGFNGFWMPRWMLMGLAPASRFSGLRDKSPRARTVAVVVPSPGCRCLAGDFTHHLGAHVFISVFQLDFLGDGHASLVTVGEPNFLSRTTLRPLGPSVAVTARLSFFHALRARAGRIRRR